MFTRANTVVLALLISGCASSAFANGQCPAIGQSQGCGILIVVTNTGINVLEDPDVGPFDGSEDSLVGVQNDSSTTVSQVTLSGGAVNIFGFEGDGLCAFTACEWLHPTTYEGPTTSFANRES